MRLESSNEVTKRRGDEMLEPQEIEVYDVYHLPIIKAYADKIDLVNTINRLVPTRMELDPGTLLLPWYSMPSPGVIRSAAQTVSTGAMTPNCCCANPIDYSRQAGFVRLIAFDLKIYFLSTRWDLLGNSDSFSARST
jgi:hypothetical protein